MVAILYLVVVAMLGIRYCQGRGFVVGCWVMVVVVLTFLLVVVVKECLDHDGGKEFSY